ncbi:hypothetical protein DRQ09_06685 [candidate division KSB1 bacterium]|nr:MAG: hypothetical protein DRQ09_06685 [candidate division KSB1 bacterium]
MILLKDKRLFFLLLSFIIFFIFPSSIQSEEFRIIKTVRKLLSKGKYYKAEELLKLRLQKKGISENEKKEIHLHLGIVYHRMNKMYLTEMEFEEVLKIDPEIILDEKFFDKDIIEIMNDVKRNTVGSLKIITIPDSSAIYINKKKKGISPLFLKSVYSDYTEITAIKENYNIGERKIYVFPGETTEVRMVLRWQDFFGILEVRTSPEKADVYINDTYEGVSPLFYTGMDKCKVKIEKDGYVPETKIIGLKRRKIIRHFQYLIEKKDKLLYSQLIPGLGQFKYGYTKHGIFFSALTLGYLIYYFNYMQNNNPLKGLPLLRYVSVGGKYYYYKDDQIISSLEYSREKAKREKLIFDYENKKTFITLAGVGIYLLNCIDTFFIIKRDLKRKMEKERKKINFEFSTGFNYGKISLEYKF